MNLLHLFPRIKKIKMNLNAVTDQILSNKIDSFERLRFFDLGFLCVRKNFHQNKFLNKVPLICNYLLLTHLMLMLGIENYL